MQLFLSVLGILKFGVAYGQVKLVMCKVRLTIQIIAVTHCCWVFILDQKASGVAVKALGMLLLSSTDTCAVVLLQPIDESLLLP